jgi:hypothetical protein
VRKSKKTDSSFDDLVREYKKLLTAGLALVAAPLALGRTGLAPPWPENVEAITALVQLIGLAITFQVLIHAAMRTKHWVVIGTFLALCFSSALYVGLLLNFTYTGANSPARSPRGFYCTLIAQTHYKDRCPYLGQAELNSAENKPTNIWTERSIEAVKGTLFFSWLVSFLSLTVFLASFVLYQKRESKSPSA